MVPRIAQDISASTEQKGVSSWDSGRATWSSNIAFTIAAIKFKVYLWAADCTNRTMSIILNNYVS